MHTCVESTHALRAGHRTAARAAFLAGCESRDEMPLSVQFIALSQTELAPTAHAISKNLAGGCSCWHVFVATCDNILPPGGTEPAPRQSWCQPLPPLESQSPDKQNSSSSTERRGWHAAMQSAQCETAEMGFWQGVIFAWCCFPTFC